MRDSNVFSRNQKLRENEKKPLYKSMKIAQFSDKNGQNSFFSFKIMSLIRSIKPKLNLQRKIELRKNPKKPPKTINLRYYACSS